MLGYDHESFWDQTPRTLSLTFDAYQEMQINAHNDRAWLAWHIAGLSRTRKMPNLTKLMMHKPRAMTPTQRIQAQIDDLIRWALARGDRVIYPDGTPYRG
jgi:hypothetical protein